jgi:hypothetical protein
MENPMRVSVLLLVLLACATATAQTQVPNTFLPGTPAKAADVNANFQALATAINALAARVDKLEGKIVQADLAGSYTLQSFQSEFNGGDFGRVANYVNTGTVTFNADGTGSYAATEAGSRLFIALDANAKLKGTSSTYVNPTETATFTWTYANNVITALGGTLTVVAGGKLLIRTSTNPTDFTQVLLLLTKK